MVIFFGLSSASILKRKKEIIQSILLGGRGRGPDSHFLSKFPLHKTKPSSRVTETFQVTELELNLAKITKCHQC